MAPMGSSGASRQCSARARTLDANAAGGSGWRDFLITVEAKGREQSLRRERRVIRPGRSALL